MPKPWWHEGVRFECQTSGKCCTSRGQVGYVYLTRADRKRMAECLGISTSELIRRYCARHDGHLHLLNKPDGVDCIFLKDKKCSVYEGRPTQCRTWPFWPEVMSPKAWKRNIAEFCPGVGKGRLISKEEILSKLETQAKADRES